MKNLLGKEIKKGISIISSCKDRNTFLKICLPSWLQFPAVKEIIIIDWGSRVPVENTLAEHSFLFGKKIKIFRVNTNPSWCLSKSYNLAARLASFDKLLKLDSEIFLLPGFFKRHCLDKKSFFRGNLSVERSYNAGKINGLLFIYRENFFSVNGFNEFIASYSWDDADLYSRLSKEGLVSKNINSDFVLHFPHSEKSRIANLPGAKSTYEEERINSEISKKGLWNMDSKMSDFKVLRTKKLGIFSVSEA
ncbi:hypothetical protein FJZ17_03325 [Candidatus Pacearchaeota archaeon]|nr:hypothetical protein [Candidatus Pacearchaeota archaeon]